MAQFFSCTRVSAQESDMDSLFSARLMEDNLALHQQVDSLEVVLEKLKSDNLKLAVRKDSLAAVILRLEEMVNESQHSGNTLTEEKNTLKKSLEASRQEVIRLNALFEQSTKQLSDLTTKLAISEQEVKELKSASELKQVKLEGKLDVHNTKLEGKDREISYLKKSLEEKELIINQKSGELAAFYREKDNSLRIIDSLARALNQKELEFIKISERLKIIESQYNEMVAKQTAAANKKKKIRFIQGVGLKTYRTPDWQLAPESASSTSIYVITNKNAGKVDFDYVTGISLSLYDLAKEDSKFTHDAGIFVGFGGQNLFKNFYIGPSFKVFDFFHVNLGANIAEYQQLKSGFSEGDPLPVGWSVSTITVKEWKTNLYFGFTIDLELLSNIPKKF